MAGFNDFCILLRNFPSISTTYWYSSNSLPHLHHHCCFVSQLKKIKLFLCLTPHFSYWPISLFPFTANFLKELAMLTVHFPSSHPFSFPLSSALPPGLHQNHPRPVTSELCSLPVLSWSVHQQLMDTFSLGGLFTQLRSSHSWLSSAPVLAPPLLPVLLLEGSSGLSPGPLLSLH